MNTTASVTSVNQSDPTGSASAYRISSNTSTTSSFSFHTARSYGDDYKITLNTIKTKDDFEKVKARVKSLPPCQIRIAKCTPETHWNDWSLHMKAALHGFELITLIEDEYEAAVLADDEYGRMQRVCKYQLEINVCENFRKIISGEPNVKAMWNRLEELVNGSGINKSIRLTIKLFQVVAQSHSLSDYGVNMQALIQDFSTAYPTIPEDYWIGLLVGSIPPKFDYLRSNLSLDRHLTLNKAYQAILQENQFLLNKESNARPMAGCNLNVKAQENKGNDQKSANFSATHCTYCDRPGHLRKFCRKRKADEKKKSGQKGGNARKQSPSSNASAPAQKQERQENAGSSNVGFRIGKLTVRLCHLRVSSDLRPAMVAPYEPPVCSSDWKQSDELLDLIDLQTPKMIDFLVDEAPMPVYSTVPDDYYAEATKPFVNVLLNSVQGADIVSSCWYLDSGAARHMSNNLLSCTMLDKIQSIIAQTADGSNLETGGVGEYVLKAMDGLIKFQDVIYCPELEASFISVACLDRRGYSVLFGNSLAKVFDRDGVLCMTGRLMDNNLYQMELTDTQKVKMFNLTVVRPNLKDIMHWHRRLGHYNLTDLLKMRERLDFNYVDVAGLRCEDCLLAKAPRLSFRPSTSRASEPLELIYSDLSGIIGTPNQNRFKYFITFTDDYSRFTTIYLLKSKDQALSTFIEYKNYVDNHVGKNGKFRMKIFRTDGGTEYINKSFEEVLANHGIAKQTTCPNSPQQNSRAERVNRTIGDMARVMLKAAGLPISLWPYAVLFAARTRNRVPHASIGYQIPYDLFYGKPAEYEDLHEFGEKVIFVGQSKGKDFACKNQYGYFVGHPQGTEGSYVYVPSTGKVIVSHAVYFLNKLDSIVQLDDSDLDLFDHDLDQQPSVSTGDSDEPTDEASLMCSFEFYRPRIEPPEQIDVDQPGPEEEFVGVQAGTPLTSSPPASTSAPPASPESSPADGVPTGYIYLTSEEREEFTQRFPEAVLEFVRPTYAGKRKKNPPCLYKVNGLFIPKSFKQATACADREKWKAATDAEILSLIHLNAIEPTDKPKDAKILPCFWLFSVKTDKYGLVVRYKARLVALGNKQEIECELDSHEFTSPVISSSSVKLLMALAVQFRFKLRHLDIATAYLHAELDEPVYLAEAPGYETGRCWRLRKSLYGLKISALNWYKTLRTILLDYGLSCCLTDNCIFFSDRLVVGVYVDDLIVLIKEDSVFDEFFAYLSSKLTVVDKGQMSKCLNMSIDYEFESGVLTIDQEQYIKEILMQFELYNSKPVGTPLVRGTCFDPNAEPFLNITLYQQITGSLLYLANSTRPDISFVVNILCRYMTAPTVEHYALAKRVLRYLKGTAKYRLVYSRTAVKPNVEIFVDSDFGNEINQDKSITGCMSFIGNCLIAWSSRKQSQISTSTCEAEVNALLESVNEAQYLNDILSELQFDSEFNRPILVFNDNQSSRVSCITGGKFSANRQYRLKLGRIRESLRDELIKIHYLSTEQMKADLLTKAFAQSKLLSLCKLIDLCVA